MTLTLYELIMLVLGVITTLSGVCNTIISLIDRFKNRSKNENVQPVGSKLDDDTR